MPFQPFGRKRGSPRPGAPETEPFSALRAFGVTPVRRVSLGRRKESYRFDRLFSHSMAVDYSVMLLRGAGIYGREKFLVWGGFLSGKNAVVTTVISPRTTGAESHGEVPADVVARVLEALEARDLVPLAQLHSHPFEAFMSEVDRQRPLVALRGFWSVIVPEFAFGPTEDPPSWSIYEFERHRTWRVLDPNEIARRLVIDDSIIKVD